MALLWGKAFKDDILQQIDEACIFTPEQKQRFKWTGMWKFIEDALKAEREDGLPHFGTTPARGWVSPENMTLDEALFNFDTRKGSIIGDHKKLKLWAAFIDERWNYDCGCPDLGDEWEAK